MKGMEEGEGVCSGGGCRVHRGTIFPLFGLVWATMRNMHKQDAGAPGYLALLLGSRRNTRLEGS